MKPTCINGCPVSVPIPQFIKALTEKDYAKVDAVIPSIGTSAHPLLAQTTPDMQFRRNRALLWREAGGGLI